MPAQGHLLPCNVDESAFPCHRYEDVERGHAELQLLTNGGRGVISVRYTDLQQYKAGAWNQGQVQGLCLADNAHRIL